MLVITKRATSDTTLDVINKTDLVSKTNKNTNKKYIEFKNATVLKDIYF